MTRFVTGYPRATQIPLRDMSADQLRDLREELFWLDAEWGGTRYRELMRRIDVVLAIRAARAALAGEGTA